MKKFKILFLLLFVNAILFAQDYSTKFNVAKSYFDNNDLTIAYNLFSEISEHSDDMITASSAVYYKALCLFKMDNLQASIAEYEDLIVSYPYSNYRETALYELGTIYYTGKRFIKTREKLLQLLNDYPKSKFNSSALYWIGKSYQEENNFTDGEKYFKESISYDSRNPFIDYALYSLANLYEENKLFDKAVTFYDELLAYHNDSPLAPLAQLRIGASYFQLREYDKSILELSDPLINELSEESLKNQAQYLLASSFFRLREYENAAKTYKKLLAVYNDPDVVNEVEYGLAWISFQMGDYEEAYKMFHKLSMSNADTISVNSLYWSAECLRYLEKTEAASGIYKDFVERFPNSKLSKSVFINLGIIEFNNKNFPQSERFLIQALSSDEPAIKGKAYTLLGELYLQRNDFEEAGNNFQNAVKLSALFPDVNKESILGLGISQFYLREYENSITNLSDVAVRYQRFEPDKVNFYLGENYFALKNYNNAIKHYHRINDDNIKFQKLSFYGKAYSYFNLKDYSNASFYFKEYISKYPGDENRKEMSLRLADCYYGLKDFDKAGEIYSKLFSGNAKIDNDFAYYQYAQSLFKSGKLSEAIDEFRTLQRKFPKSRFADDSQYLIGWINFQQNNFTEAIKNYEEIFSKYPGSTVKPIAIYSIGDSYYNMGQYEKALEYYLRLLSDYSNTRFIFDAINGIQYCYLAEDQPEKAVSVIDRFISNNPRSEFAEEILLKKGEIYYSLGNYKNSEASYKEFIELYPRSNLLAEANYWVGKSASMLSENDTAIRYFRIVTNSFLNSKFGVDAVIEMGELYKHNENYQEALNLYTTTLPKIKDESRIPEVMFNKAMLQLQLKDYSNAYATFNEIINYYDGSIFADKAKIELAVIEMARSEFANSENLLKELGEKRTDDIGAQAQYLYGTVLFEQGKIDDAISALVRVRSVFSSYDYWYSKSLIALGDCYVKKNDKVKARDMYRAIIQKHSNDELGAEARKKLNAI